MQVAIRPMTMADTSTVGEVHVRAWQAAYRGVMPDEYLNGLRPEDRAEMWRRGIEANCPANATSSRSIGMWQGSRPTGRARE